MSRSFLTLPPEVVEQTLCNVRPMDVAAVSCTCKALFKLIYQNDSHIWRNLFLQLFDDPRRSGDKRLPYDWRGELQRRMRARNIILGQRNGQSIRGTSAHKHFSAIETIIRVAFSTGDFQTQLMSRSMDWVEDVMKNAHGAGYPLLSMMGTKTDDKLLIPFEYPISTSPSEPTSLRARLCVYSGLSYEDKEVILASPLNDNNLRVRSRALVYDLDRYNQASHWGPLSWDGRRTVDWQLLLAIVLVISLNVHDHVSYVEPCLHVFHPVGFPHHALTLPQVSRVEIRLTGPVSLGIGVVWCPSATIAPQVDTASRSTAIFQDADFVEGVHVLLLHLEFVGADLDAPESKLFPDRPLLHFSGSTLSEKGHAQGKVSGHVCMTPDREVQWTLQTDADDGPLWSSVGIQIGGVGSAMGVAGIWTRAIHGMEPPTGPFWTWRLD
ncbi:hypothetical protein BS47DRAFT_1482106 [Hydnum rufescens UP504]|uniref:F-box domain-containing protein n=1 Tax=Hydnum rufescens UP504 TaxID=1448309 RepID=A0A9P6B8D5_9AGAM|nr:hypothetical protein BS47DRAFT_1482106 [Hydnum rufescens UP504]